MSYSVHYYTIITKEYVSIANFGLQTFKKFNDIELNVYILDDCKPKLDYDKVNYIPLTKSIVLDNFNDQYISSHTINCAIQMLQILDKEYDILVRIDLDSIFYCSVVDLVNFSIANQVGFLGSAEYWNDVPRPGYLNCGISVINKHYLPKISFVEEFTNFYNPEIYTCPEQDYLNTLPNKQAYPGMVTMSSNQIAFIASTDFTIIHLNGKYTKPFVKLYQFTELIFCFIDVVYRLAKNTEFIDVITENKKFLYTEFKQLPIDKQIKLLKFRSKVVEKSNMLWSM